jgi:hypothetical protein
LSEQGLRPAQESESIEEINFMKKLLIALCALVSVTTQAQHNTAQSLTLSESLTLTHPGEFTKGQMHTYSQTLLNGGSPTLFSAEQKVYATAAITGAVIVPASSGVIGGYGLMSLVENHSTTTQAAGAYFQNIAAVDNSFVEGLNTLSTDTAGTRGSTVIGYEMDVGPNGSPKSLFGLTITGGAAPGAVPPQYATAVWVTPINWKWWYGVSFGPGATSASAIWLDGASSTRKNSGSQNIGFQSWDAAGANHVSKIFTDQSGILQANINGAAHSQKLLTGQAGACVFTGAPRCSVSFASPFMVPPIVILTPINPGGTTFAIINAPTATGFTINASSGNSVTVNYMAIANPN